MQPLRSFITVGIGPAGIGLALVGSMSYFVATMRVAVGATSSIPPTQEHRDSAPPHILLAEAPLSQELEPGPNPLLFPTKPEEVEVPNVQPIRLQDAVELARRNNRTLQSAQLSLERSRAVLREQRAALYPSLSSTASAVVQEQDQAVRDTFSDQGLNLTNINRNDSQGSTSIGANIRLDYNVFSAGARSSGISAAEQQVRLDELQVEQQAEQIRLDVATAYYTLQNADEQTRIARQAVSNAEQSLKDAQALEQAGLGTRFDVLRAEVQLANENQNLTDRQADQKRARRQLAELLSLSQSTEISAADPVEVAGQWPLSLEESIVLAYKNRAELEAQLVQRDLNEQQQRVARSSTRPQVGVFAQYDISKSFNETGSTSENFNSSSDIFSSQYQVGLQVQWNFFDGGATRARSQQERLDQQIAEVNFANTRNQVRLQVEDAYFQLRAQGTNIQTAAKALEQAKESLRLARLRFQAGVGTQTDVINAETELTRAEGNLVTATIGYNQSLANLQRAVSNLPGVY